MNLLDLYKTKDNLDPTILNQLIGLKIKEIRNSLSLSQETLKRKLVYIEHITDKSKELRKI